MRSALRLAALLGRSLHELGETVTAEEFGLWLAFFEKEPMGPAQLMPALAEIRAAMANGPLKAPQGRLWSSDDFFDAKRWVAAPAEAQPSGPTRDQLASWKRMQHRMKR